MPEKLINRAQRNDSLIYLQSHGAEINLSFGPNNEQKIGTFNGEAFWILFKEIPDFDVMGGYGVNDYDSFRFSCGDTTGQAMEAEGVLSFSEEPIQK